MHEGTPKTQQAAASSADQRILERANENCSGSERDECPPLWKNQQKYIGQREDSHD